MKIDVKGIIIPNDDKWIYDWFEMDSVCPKDILPLIDKAKGEKLDVYINSGGGDVFAGSEIYSALREYTGEVNIHIVGYAGSAASIIACAGYSDITPTGMFMWHNVSGGARGDYHVMDKSSEILKTANKAISAAYQIKTGKSEKELLESMDKETWITAQEAVEQGFVDKIAENQNLKLVAFSGTSMIPQQVIDKILNMVKSPLDKNPLNQAGFLTPEKAQAKLKLLKLGGIR
ncbi:MAG TPA: peptidase [Pelotomaculum sp.]|nr:peptidase [Pelotomaculum sp.]